jgi:hypothetical protein
MCVTCVHRAAFTGALELWQSSSDLRRNVMAIRTTLAMGALALASALVPVQISAQSRAEAYTATASMKTAGGASMTAPVAIDVVAWTSDADRKRLAGALKSGGDAALQKQLADMKTLGTVTVGKTKFDAKYAYAMTSSEGRIITVVTTSPIFFVGAGAPSAKPTTGHRFGVVTIEVNDAGSGKGTLTPAASVKMSDSDAIVVEDYSAELVMLPDVRKK